MGRYVNLPLTFYKFHCTVLCLFFVICDIFFSNNPLHAHFIKNSSKTYPNILIIKLNFFLKTAILQYYYTYQPIAG